MDKNTLLSLAQSYVGWIEMGEAKLKEHAEEVRKIASAIDVSTNNLKAIIEQLKTAA